MSGTLLQRLHCYLTGHDYSMRSDDGRMYLRCDECGHRSNGWSLGERLESRRPPRDNRPPAPHNASTAPPRIA